jgi:hypothetical protein
VRHGLDDVSNRPDEAQHLAADGDHGLMTCLSASQQMTIAFVQALLRIPGDRTGRRGNVTLTFAQIARNAGSMAIVPSRLDDDPAQMRIPRLGDAAATNASAAAVLGRHHAGVRHQFARAAKPTDVSQFAHDGCSSDQLHASHRLQCPDRRSVRRGLCKCLDFSLIASHALLDLFKSLPVLQSTIRCTGYLMQ